MINMWDRTDDKLDVAEEEISEIEDTEIETLK